MEPAARDGNPGRRVLHPVPASFRLSLMSLLSLLSSTSVSLPPRDKLPRVAVAFRRGEPMDFSVAEAVREMTAIVRRFLDAEVMPVERLVLERGFGAGGLEIERLRGQVREMGMLAPHMPRDWGGGGFHFLD